MAEDVDASLALAGTIASEALASLVGGEPLELDGAARERLREVVVDALAGAGTEGCEVVVAEADAAAGTVGVRVTGPAWLLEPWAGYGGVGATDASFGVGAGPGVRGG